MQVAGMSIPGAVSSLAQAQHEKIQALLQQKQNEAKEDPARRVKELFAPSPFGTLFDVKV